MKKYSFFIGSVIAIITSLVICQVCFAWPSSEFQEKEDGIYDDWHICRTRQYGDDGYFQLEVTETKTSMHPLIPLESLGEYSDIAYKLGEQFAEKYPDQIQRAEKIFEYVRDSIQYTTDLDQFDMPEYAQNADELASILHDKGTALADCEECAILLAVIFQGAGYRSGIVICPGHAAAILHLPNYEKANMIFTLNDVPGWIWLEATGNNNPFGWFPKGQIEGPFLGSEISSDEHLPLYEPQPPVLNPIGDKEVTEGEKLDFAISATDANDDPLIYSASNLPTGANFNVETRIFSWTPDKAGIFSGIHFEVSDGKLTDSKDVTVTVKSGSKFTIIVIISIIVVVVLVAVAIFWGKRRRA